ncbi:ABC transporter substrate-binding protein [Bacillus sp. Bva_UNVM-123]|uniref:ABC transporter substrate-binding protein n=1 Tax=Bacillus sp. Bva_UNVM-123 TaxID=2829798 RepID=UPI00391F6980
MKTKWYFFILLLITASLLFNNLISKQEQSPIKIGVVMIGDSRIEKLKSLKRGLADLGYEEKSITFVVINANDDETKLRKEIDELLKNKPQIVVTLGGVETLTVKEKLEKHQMKIPVVFAGVAAPKEIGIIEDYRSPGGLFTGINNYHTSISGKRLELLHELVPTSKRFHVLYDKNTKVSVLSLENVKEAANKLSLQINPINVSEPDFLVQLSKTVQEKDALLMLPGFRIESLTGEIAKFSRKYKIPTMGVYGTEVEEGILASYGVSFADQGYQAARYVSLIIQGNSPSDIPVELPDTIRFYLNQSVCNELGVKLNQELIPIANFIYPHEEGR